MKNNVPQLFTKLSAMKKLFFMSLLIVQQSYAQKVIFSDNFEKQKIDSSHWQIIDGSWHIAGVEELRIAPAENGYRYVLCSGNNFIYKESIRFIVDLPDSLKAKKIKLSFYYYSNTPIQSDGEFYQREIKDGLRGKPWKNILPAASRQWKQFQKILTVPLHANTLYLVFTVTPLIGSKNKLVCFDNVIVSAMK